MINPIHYIYCSESSTKLLRTSIGKSWIGEREDRHPWDGRRVVDMNNKIAAIVVIAIVVIAAAAAGVYLLAGDDNEDDPTIDLVGNDVYLEIFGNANGDYRLDDADIEIIEGYVSGEIPEDELIRVADADEGVVRYLADANCDGVVDSEDVTYLESIMDRSAEYMYFLDGYGHFSRSPLHIDRIASEYLPNCEILTLFGVQDKIVAVDNAPYVLADYYLMNMSDSARANLANMNSNSAPNYELVAEKEPDIWLTFVNSVMTKRNSGQTNAEVFSLNLNNFNAANIYESGCVKGVLLAGYLFDNTERAEEYVSWIVNLWETIDSRTSQLTDDERPVVMYTMYAHYITTGSSNMTLRLYTENDPLYQATVLAGGKNLVDRISDFGDYSSSQADSYQIDLEWIVDQQGTYDYLFCHSVKYQGNGQVVADVPSQGYLCDDDTEFREAQESLNEIDIFTWLNDDQCYITNSDYRNNAAGGMLLAAYMSIILHPDLFSDFDMQEIHQSYIDMLGYDYDLGEHGVFYYLYD